MLSLEKKYSSQRPQELDDAARRRFVKKLYIPLPEFDGRKQIIVNLMRKQGHDLTEDDINHIAEQTDGIMTKFEITSFFTY